VGWFGGRVWLVEPITGHAAAMVEVWKSFLVDDGGFVAGGSIGLRCLDRVGEGMRL
jgi:hypothetical protein